MGASWNWEINHAIELFSSNVAGIAKTLIANAHTTRGVDGQAYQRKIVSFEAALQASSHPDSRGVRVSEISRDTAPGQMISHPSHPHADEKGMLRMPNVNLAHEMVDMVTASRTCFSSATEIIATSIEIRIALVGAPSAPLPRIAIAVAGVSRLQQRQELTVAGPSVKVAFDAEGNPTAGVASPDCASPAERPGEATPPAAPGETPPNEAAGRITSSLIRDRLIATLNRWFSFDLSPKTREILWLTDAHPYRDALRDAIETRDGKRVAELADQPEALTQPAGFITVLGRHQGRRT